MTETQELKILVEILQSRVHALERKMSYRTTPTPFEMDLAQRQWQKENPNGHPLEGGAWTTKAKPSSQ